MTKKSTKRALLTSVSIIVLCLVMLMGITFAWFTDTASTGVNKITSGNLHIQIQDKDGTAISNLDWTAKDGRAQEKILWEPGCTYTLTPFKIVNTGNLALKYKIKVTGLDGDADLLKVIKFTYQEEDSEAFDIDAEGHLTAKGTDTAETGMITISAHMDEAAGNEYQDKSLEGVELTVMATQDTVESDSYGTDYDKNAAYAVPVKDQTEVNDAITNAAEKNVSVALPAKQTITLDNGIANEGDKARNVTFIGDGTQTVDVITKAVNAEGGQLNYQRGSSFTFSNVTIKAGEGSFDGIVCDELTFQNCTISGKLALYSKATFVNCTFENTMANQYSIWTWGGTDVTFENCTFNTNGKAILLYGRASAENLTNLVVNSCTFNDRNNGAAGKAAVEVGNDYNATYKLTISKATVNGFADGKNTGSKLWANKDSMDAAHLTVTIDGTKVQ